MEVTHKGLALGGPFANEILESNSGPVVNVMPEVDKYRMATKVPTEGTKPCNETFEIETYRHLRIHMDIEFFIHSSLNQEMFKKPHLIMLHLIEQVLRLGSIAKKDKPFWDYIRELELKVEGKL